MAQSPESRLHVTRQALSNIVDYALQPANAANITELASSILSTAYSTTRYASLVDGFCDYLL